MHSYLLTPDDIEAKSDSLLSQHSFFYIQLKIALINKLVV